MICAECRGKLYGIAQVVGKREKSRKVVCLKCGQKHGIPILRGEK